MENSIKYALKYLQEDELFATLKSDANTIGNLKSIWLINLNYLTEFTGLRVREVI